MKKLIILVAVAAISGCFSTFRGVMQDEYTSEAEMLDAFDSEMSYFNVVGTDRVADLRERVLEFYRKMDGTTFDEDILRDWVREQIVNRLAGN